MHLEHVCDWGGLWATDSVDSESDFTLLEIVDESDTPTPSLDVTSNRVEEGDDSVLIILQIGMVFRVRSIDTPSPRLPDTIRKVVGRSIIYTGYYM